MHNTIQIIEAKKNEIKFEEQRDSIFTKKEEKNQKKSEVKQSQQSKQQRKNRRDSREKHKFEGFRWERCRGNFKRRKFFFFIERETSRE